MSAVGFAVECIVLELKEGSLNWEYKFGRYQCIDSVFKSLNMFYLIQYIKILCKHVIDIKFVNEVYLIFCFIFLIYFYLYFFLLF